MSEVDEAPAAEKPKRGKKAAKPDLTGTGGLNEALGGGTPPELTGLAAALNGPDGQGEPDVAPVPPKEVLDESLGRLGDAIAREQSKVDLSEGAHVTAIERMEGLATDYEVDVRSLVPDVRDFLLDQIKSRPKPWSATSKGEQHDVAAACEHAAVELVRKIVEAVAASGKNEPIRCLLVGYSDKGDDIKVDLKVKALSEPETVSAVIGLHKAKGKHVLLTVASVDDYRGDGREAELMEDEPPLDFEAGELDPPPADDSDLAEAGYEVRQPDAHPLRTGDRVDVPNYGSCEVRVNVSTGMIEAKHANRDDFDIDVRGATPEEMAGERKRTDGFSDEDIETRSGVAAELENEDEAEEIEEGERDREAREAE